MYIDVAVLADANLHDEKYSSFADLYENVKTLKDHLILTINEYKISDNVFRIDQIFIKSTMHHRNIGNGTAAQKLLYILP